MARLPALSQYSGLAGAVLGDAGCCACSCKQRAARSLGPPSAGWSSSHRFQRPRDRRSRLTAAWETHPDGLNHLLAQTEIRLVVDFANVRERAVREVLQKDVPQRRIAYFHIRNLPTRPERPSLAACEARAEEAFPQHPFLWEPKTLSGSAGSSKHSVQIPRSRTAGQHRRRHFLPVSRCPPDIISGSLGGHPRAQVGVKKPRSSNRA